MRGECFEVCLFVHLTSAEFDVLKMKVCKIQQYVPPVATSLSSAENSSGNYEPHNISPTSSSSFSPNNPSSRQPSLISLPPGGHHPGFYHPGHHHSNYHSHANQNQHQSLNALSYLPHSRLSLPVNQYAAKHYPLGQQLLGHQFHTYPNFVHQQQLFNATLAVHLNCNKCGKNLLDKSSSHLDSSQRMSTLNYSHATGQLHQFFSSNNPLSQQISISTKPSSHNVSISGSNKHNEHYIFGCQNCAHFLPQCTICLKVMRINLYPSPLVMVSNPNNSLMSMNRSQSFFMQSPQIMLPAYSSQSNIKNAANASTSSKPPQNASNMIKSPLSSTNLAKIASGAHNSNNLMPQSKSSNEILSSSSVSMVPVKSFKKTDCPAGELRVPIQLQTWQMVRLVPVLQTWRPY